MRSHDDGLRMEQEQALLAMQKDRDTLRAELDQAVAENRTLQATSTEMTALRDELDMLRPLRNEVISLQSSSARLQTRLSELQDAKQSLKVRAVGQPNDTRQA